MSPIVRMMKRYINMPLKKALPLLFIVALVLSATTGCATKNTSSESSPTAAASVVTSTKTPTATPTSIVLDAADFDKFFAALKDRDYKNFTNVKEWSVEQINSTSAHVRMLTAANATVSFDRTIIVFPTTQDATNYLNAMNLTAYSSGSGADTTAIAAYQNVTGHAPLTTKNYAWTEGDFNDFSTIISHGIHQIDNVIITSDMHQVS